MPNLNCRFERLSNFSIGVAFILVGLGFVVIGLTVIPVFGLLIAAPLLVAGALFIKAHRSEECIMEDQTAKEGLKQ